jgi:Glycerophosphoryl diester phosphodiesterase family
VRHMVGLAGAVVLAAALLPGVPATAGGDAVPGTGSCPLLIAHRGGAYGAAVPENSMQAFEAAVAAGVDVIETDVWFTSDRRAVLMHDRRLDRTTTGSGPVGARTLAQVRALRLVAEPSGRRLPTDQRVPTLHELLTFAKARGVTVLPEYKDRERPSRIRRYYRQIRASGVRAIVGGFSRVLMRVVHRANPGQQLVWFRKSPIRDPGTVPAGADVGLLSTAVTGEEVAGLAAAGVHTDAWFDAAAGTDSPAGDRGWAALAGAGVTWITTDHPQEYRAWQGTDACRAGPD